MNGSTRRDLARALARLTGQSRLLGQDYLGHPAFIDAVESDITFRALVNADPLGTAIYRERPS